MTARFWQGRFLQSVAKIVKQDSEARLLVDLGLVVRGPVLLVGFLFRESNGLGLRNRTIAAEFPLDREFDSIDVFAFVASFVIGARAGAVGGIDGVLLVAAALGRNEPLVVLLLEFAHGCDDDA